MRFILDCSSASATACALTNPHAERTLKFQTSWTVTVFPGAKRADMDPSIKFDDYSAEEQALMKSAPYVMKPLQDWHYKDVLHFFKTNVTNEKNCIKAYI
jgi:hypothetical protein